MDPLLAQSTSSVVAKLRTEVADGIARAAARWRDGLRFTWCILSSDCVSFVRGASNQEKLLSNLCVLLEHVVNNRRAPTRKQCTLQMSIWVRSPRRVELISSLWRSASLEQQHVRDVCVQLSTMWFDGLFVEVGMHTYCSTQTSYTEPASNRPCASSSRVSWQRCSSRAPKSAGNYENLSKFNVQVLSTKYW